MSLCSLGICKGLLGLLGRKNYICFTEEVAYELLVGKAGTQGAWDSGSRWRGTTGRDVRNENRDRCLAPG
jgi:hypothetical protein